MSFILKGFPGLTIAGVASAAILFGPAAPASAEKPIDSTTAPPTHLRTITVPSPCPGPDCPEGLEPQAQGLRTVYLNFDGVTLTRGNDNAVNNVSGIIASSQVTIPPLDVSNATIQAVVERLETIHAPYNVNFTTTRPANGPYQMVVFGGTCQSVAGQSGCAGIALLDCGDFNPNNVVFVFPGGLNIGDAAATAAQENAHSYGLAHTLDENDVMYPTVLPEAPMAFGAGSIPNDGSNACTGANYQDSHQLMLDTIGPRGQDTMGPSIDITSPAPGGAVSAGSLVTASVSDTQSAVAWVNLEIDGEEVGRVESPPYEFAIPSSTPAGERLVTVRAGDSQGNTGFDRITVFMTDGSEDPCDNDDDCPDGFECSSNLCVPDNGIDGEIGDECTTGEDCLNGMCATLGDESRCTQGCNEGSPCPQGFDCVDDIACWPADGGGGGGGGCDASGSSSGAATALLLLLGAALLSRRRRVTVRKR